MKKVRGERNRTRLCKTDVNLQENEARERLYAPYHHGLFCLASIFFFQALCRVLEKERKKENERDRDRRQQIQLADRDKMRIKRGSCVGCIKRFWFES